MAGRALVRRALARSRTWRRRRDEAGYAAILVALLASTVFIGCAAMGVDTARWYVEAESVQKAADAAALAGVTYMPNDLATARATALTVAARNGYAVGTDVTVTVTAGTKASELNVTISSRVTNSFGGYLGIRRSWITRSAVADYTAPAPMGSPCNVFGNEPPAGSKDTYTTGLPNSAATNCFQDSTSKLANPNFWAGIEGPSTDKLQGDRYQALKCSEDGNAVESTYGCSGNVNSEYNDDGYYFIVHVEAEAVGYPLSVQVYDPAYVNAGVYCNQSSGSAVDNMNDYATTDGTTRYGSYSASTSNSSAVRKYCPGDLNPGSPSSSTATTTTFVMLDRTVTNNPENSAVLTACSAKQFRGFSSLDLNALNRSKGNYNDQLAQVYHQWYTICTFTPTAKGDYYMQVRTNIALGGSSSTNTNSNNPVIYSGNPAAAGAGGLTTGAGANGFAVRAIPSSLTARPYVSVSAWQRMPILQIAASPATFNLVRALPNAKGQYLTFDFFDAADGSTGTVKVLPPTDSTGTVQAITGIPGCRGGRNDVAPSTYAVLVGCSYGVTGTQTDGQVVHMVIPIPTDYDCDDSILTGCWFKVRLTYDNTSITDFTTWSANVGGDPVRLIK